jgi:hypothetical protein
VLADLRAWSRRRRLVAAAVALATVGGLVLAAAMVPGTAGPAAPWWAFVAVGSGGILLGLLVAGYLDAPIGAEATVCDLRWPMLGVVGLYLASDARALVPTLSAEVRPAVALAAVAVLVWALAGRLRGERRALAADRRREAVRSAGSADDAASDGETCTTCRPLFPTRIHSSGGTAP